MKEDYDVSRYICYNLSISAFGLALYRFHITVKAIIAEGEATNLQGIAVQSKLRAPLLSEKV